MGLDPELKFRLLVVARGFAPARTSKHLDPEAGEAVVRLKRHDLDRRKPERIVRGRVVNENGDPVAHAIIEPVGVKRGRGGSFGALERLGIDVLAVTDDDGGFRIGVGADGDALYLLVKAAFLAPVQTRPLAAGPMLHTIKLGPGVTVTGRVVKNGRPLPGVGLGMVQANRDVVGFLGHFESGTDRDGQFALVNVPPEQSWHFYGLMESLKDFGSVPIRDLATRSHGSTRDLGDIEVQPGHRLTGRLVLADGKRVPPDTRVLVSRKGAWDSQTATVGPNGEFSFTGLPAERVGLSTNVRGHHPSPKNASFDLLNKMGLLGMVGGDIKNLRFLLDPGPVPHFQRLNHEEYVEYGRRINRTLSGVSDGETP